MQHTLFELFEDEYPHPREHAVSALHKEIRRGAAENAVAWVRYLARFPDYDVRKYLRKIVLEETRCVALAYDWLHIAAVDPSIAATILAVQEKKWQSRGRFELFERSLRASRKGLRIDVRTARSAKFFDRLNEVCLESTDVDVLYTALWSARRARMTFGVYDVDIPLRRLCVRVDARLDRVFNNDPHYAPELAIDHIALCAHHHVPVVCHTLKAAEGVCWLAPYVFDNHTASGKASIIKHYKAIRPQQPLPDGLDLRWSGMVSATLWRFAAFAQHGDYYTDAPWESVAIDDEQWSLACDVDHLYYPYLP